MKKIVLKFGGSSLADNTKLNIVANKIIDFYNKGNKVVVVVSAQGKTTDKLIKEAKELAYNPDEREMDVLLSTGEQISISKLSILLNRLGYNAISLTGWQAGILTNKNNGEAKIESINATRIETELDKNKIVVIAGFQGISEESDITTLGRGGSDTSAVGIAAAINADHCYIFSDVDGVYSTDPNKITEAKKLNELSYTEMLDMSNEGAKVLHNRCVEIAQKYNVTIETGSTFNDNTGTVIQNKVEETSVKSIVKNDDIFLIHLKNEQYNNKIFNDICNTLLANGIVINNLVNSSIHNLDISFTIKRELLTKFQALLDKDFKDFHVTLTNVSKISLIGYGIISNKEMIRKVLQIINSKELEVIELQIEECKLSFTTSEKCSDSILRILHNEIII